MYIQYILYKPGGMINHSVAGDIANSGVQNHGMRLMAGKPVSVQMAVILAYNGDAIRFLAINHLFK